MKRLGIIIAVALGLASVDASAQWYIFPGFSQKQQAAAKPREQQKAGDTLSVAIKQPVDTVIAVPVAGAAAIPEEYTFPAADTVPAASIFKPEEFVVDIPEIINVGLLLPFESKGRTNPSMMEFYCGALLAARELGREGIKIDLNVYDCSPGKPGISEWDFYSTDVLIGPVSFADIANQLDIHPEGKYFISPLDAQAVQLIGTSPVIQASAGQDVQIQEMLSWLQSELAPEDKVVIVQESGVELTDYSRKVIDGLENLGISYDKITYGILQGLKIGGEFLNKSSYTGVTRFLIASENESFVGDAVRNMALLQHKGRQTALYGTSKLRSYQSIEADDFHAVGLRLAATFYTDYTDPDVKSFVLAYRSLFNAEPGSFAFSGYDITRFFTSLCNNIGRNWGQIIEEYYGRGLYSDFNFERPEGSVGATSAAVRHMVFNPDYTITLIK